MTVAKLVHAYTNPGADTPPYINVSRMDDDTVRVIVRGKPYPNHMSGTEEIILSEADWRSLAWSVYCEANDHEHLAGRSVAAPLGDEQVRKMAERFLSWKLPENFNPDGGISFQKVGNEGTTYEFKREPSGTNLLDFTQAAAMVRHMLGDVPATALVPSAWRGKSASGELKFTQLPRVAEVWGEQGLEVIPLYA